MADGTTAEVRWRWTLKVALSDVDATLWQGFYERSCKGAVMLEWTAPLLLVAE